MAGQIRMTPETMRARSREAESQARVMEDLNRKMTQLLNTLKQEWEGEAMVGYEARFGQIKPILTNAHELLREIAHNLDKSAEIVERTDAEIGRQFKSQV